MTESALRLTNVSVRYEQLTVLDDVSLEVREGETLALVGASGAGKSTLLRLLFERAGHDVALVPQELGLVESLSVFHNVYMGRLRRHSAAYNLLNLIRPLGREIEPVAGVLARVDLGDKLHEPVGQLSGGQRQRTAVARALHQQASLLMADEPVSAVDEHQSRRIMHALCSGHRTTVLAMHDLTLAIEFADRIVGLRNGRIMMDASTQGMRTTDLDGLYAQ